MVIQIDGVGTVNKGAELMFLAILQEIERKHPGATVIYNDSTFMESNRQADYFASSLKIMKPYYMGKHFTAFLKKSHIQGIAERIDCNWDITHTLHKLHHAKPDLLFNASGFRISDQFNLTDSGVQYLDRYLSDYKKRGTKIVYLPQAFGPAHKSATKAALEVLSKHCDLLFAREGASYDCLQSFGFTSPPAYQYPDFTSVVNGVIPTDMEHLKGGVCLIPNMQMVNKKVMSYPKYLEFWNTVITTLQQAGLRPFVLNHEGLGDVPICKKISAEFKIENVNGLNAAQTKGVIGQSFMVVSSRFHGVASALSSAVPCLATSWSHKYQLLFEEYDMTDCVLDLGDDQAIRDKILHLLNESNNREARQQLSAKLQEINSRCRQMWDLIWSL